MELYDSQTLRLESLEPIGDAIKVYVCGITPYDTTHLGHAFTYASADLLIRYLEHRGYVVEYVQNVTDIDDDILKRASEVGEDWLSLGNRWTAHFIRDMITLNVRPPDYFPRATDVIPEIIEAVGRILQSGAGYVSGGSVYFSVDQWPDYGRLCRLSREEMLPIANERGNRPDDPNKRDSLDFVLWQAQAPGEPAWESPWGPGRPGWHIECSTMAAKYLGDQIDIHSGGADLLFPHHESEIAQIEAVTGRPFSQFWMHIAMVHHTGEKMSKSLGNLVMIRDLLNQWPPDAIRLYLASRHYREVWSYDAERLERSARLADRVRHMVTLESGPGEPLRAENAMQDFYRAMDRDLDTPRAMHVMEDLASRIESASRDGRELSSAQAMLRTMAGIFGLRLDRPEPEPRVREGWQNHLGRFPAQAQTSGTQASG